MSINPYTPELGPRHSNKSYTSPAAQKISTASIALQLPQQQPPSSTSTNTNGYLPLSPDQRISQCGLNFNFDDTMLNNIIESHATNMLKTTTSSLSPSNFDTFDEEGAQNVPILSLNTAQKQQQQRQPSQLKKQKQQTNHKDTKVKPVSFHELRELGLSTRTTKYDTPCSKLLTKADLQTLEATSGSNRTIFENLYRYLSFLDASHRYTVNQDELANIFRTTDRNEQIWAITHSDSEDEELLTTPKHKPSKNQLITPTNSTSRSISSHKRNTNDEVVGILVSMKNFFGKKDKSLQIIPPSPQSKSSLSSLNVSKSTQLHSPSTPKQSINYSTTMVASPGILSNTSSQSITLTTTTTTALLTTADLARHVTFDTVLAHPALLHYFSEMAKREKSDEALLLWKDVLLLYGLYCDICKVRQLELYEWQKKHKPHEEQKGMSLLLFHLTNYFWCLSASLFEIYVIDGSPHQTNLPSRISKSIEHSLCALARQTELLNHKINEIATAVAVSLETFEYQQRLTKLRETIERNKILEQGGNSLMDLLAPQAAQDEYDELTSGISGDKLDALESEAEKIFILQQLDESYDSFIGKYIEDIMDIYLAAANEAYALLKRDTFSRFTSTSLYAKMLHDILQQRLHYTIAHFNAQLPPSMQKFYQDQLTIVPLRDKNVKFFKNVISKHQNACDMILSSLKFQLATTPHLQHLAPKNIAAGRGSNASTPRITTPRVIKTTTPRLSTPKLSTPRTTTRSSTPKTTPKTSQNNLNTFKSPSLLPKLDLQQNQSNLVRRPLPVSLFTGQSPRLTKQCADITMLEINTAQLSPIMSVSSGQNSVRSPLGDSVIEDIIAKKNNDSNNNNAHNKTTPTNNQEQITSPTNSITSPSNSTTSSTAQFSSTSQNGSRMKRKPGYGFFNDGKQLSTSPTPSYQSITKNDRPSQSITSPSILGPSPLSMNVLSSPFINKPLPVRATTITTTTTIKFPQITNNNLTANNDDNIHNKTYHNNNNNDILTSPMSQPTSQHSTPMKKLTNLDALKNRDSGNGSGNKNDSTPNDSSVSSSPVSKSYLMIENEHEPSRNSHTRQTSIFRGLTLPPSRQSSKRDVFNESTSSISNLSSRTTSNVTTPTYSSSSNKENCFSSNELATGELNEINPAIASLSAQAHTTLLNNSYTNTVNTSQSRLSLVTPSASRGNDFSFKTALQYTRHVSNVIVDDDDDDDWDMSSFGTNGVNNNHGYNSQLHNRSVNDHLYSTKGEYTTGNLSPVLSTSSYVDDFHITPSKIHITPTPTKNKKVSKDDQQSVKGYTPTKTNTSSTSSKIQLPTPMLNQDKKTDGSDSNNDNHENNIVLDNDTNKDNDQIDKKSSISPPQDPQTQPSQSQQPLADSTTQRNSFSLQLHKPSYSFSEDFLGEEIADMMLLRLSSSLNTIGRTSGNLAPTVISPSNGTNNENNNTVRSFKLDGSINQSNDKITSGSVSVGKDYLSLKQELRSLLTSFSELDITDQNIYNRVYDSVPNPSENQVEQNNSSNNNNTSNDPNMSNVNPQSISTTQNSTFAPLMPLTPPYKPLTNHNQHQQQPSTFTLGAAPTPTLSTTATPLLTKTPALQAKRPLTLNIGKVSPHFGISNHDNNNTNLNTNGTNDDDDDKLHPLPTTPTMNKNTIPTSSAFVTPTTTTPSTHFINRVNYENCTILPTPQVNGMKKSAPESLLQYAITPMFMSTNKNAMLNNMGYSNNNNNSAQSSNFTSTMATPRPLFSTRHKNIVPLFSPRNPMTARAMNNNSSINRTPSIMGTPSTNRSNTALNPSSIPNTGSQPLDIVLEANSPSNNASTTTTIDLMISTPLLLPNTASATSSQLVDSTTDYVNKWNEFKLNFIKAQQK